MIIVPLPTPEVPNIQQSVTLDGQAFLFTYTWSGRRSKWLLHIDDTDGNSLLADTPLLPFMDLLETVAKDERPGGALVLLTPDSDYLSLTNTRHSHFLYITEADLVFAAS